MSHSELPFCEVFFDGVLLTLSFYINYSHMKVNCSQASQYKQHQIKMLLDLALFEVPLFYELIKKVNHRHGQEKKHMKVLLDGSYLDTCF